MVALLRQLGFAYAYGPLTAADSAPATA
jgi:hypothetical protein